MIRGRCPKCEAPIAEAIAERIAINAPGGIWTGISYLCPSCQVVLGISIDPIAHGDDLVSEIVEKIRPA